VWRSLYRGCDKGLTVRGLNLGRGKRFFCCPKRSDRLLSPVCLVFGGSLGSFPDMNLTTHPYLASRLGISGSIHLLPHTCLRDMYRDDLLYIFRVCKSVHYHTFN
jgi:hypothetical protein